MLGMCLMQGKRQQTQAGHLMGGSTTLKYPQLSRRFKASSAVRPLSIVTSRLSSNRNIVGDDNEDSLFVDVSGGGGIALLEFGGPHF
jgi:hypothetical protein